MPEPVSKITVGLNLLARQLGVELADLSSVPDPAGRIDYLASQLIAHGVRALSPEVQMTYHTIRPLLDGFLASKLGQVQVRIPDEVKALFSQSDPVGGAPAAPRCSPRNREAA